MWIAALALALSPSGAAAKQGSDPVDTLGRTVLLAIGSTSAGDAVGAIGDGLALLGARYRLEEEGGAEGTGARREPARVVPRNIDDPLQLPPASAGTNGTTVSHTSSLGRDEIFAHRPAGGDPGSTAILLTGVALAPPEAPEAVKGAINAANMIIGRPYIWGGGHASFYSRGYDCSGAVSFALFGGGLIPRPLSSSELERWGAPGRGRWITVYANAGHVFAEIAGLRWDTVGDEQGTGPRWHLAGTSTNGFVVRHPPGF